MAYTHKTNGSIVEISRNDLVVATYDPITEETNYVNPSYEKYAGHVGRVIAELKQDPSADVVEEPVATEVATVVEAPVDLEAEVKRLKNLVSLLQVENAMLKGTKQKAVDTNTIRQPERFVDSIDLTGAPQQEPALGDLTPAFIEWARKNMPKDIFEKRYKNRLKETK